jgi:hypothetical protein
MELQTYEGSKLYRAAAILVLLCTLPFATSASSIRTELMAKPEWQAAANEAAVDVLFIYALTLVESMRYQGDNQQVAPSPFVIRSDVEGAKYFGTKAEAHAAIEQYFLSYPDGSLDIGPAQINTRYHGHRVEKLTDLLDLGTNLKIAGQILAENMKTADSLFQAVGRYHTWADQDRATDYADKVFRIYRNLLNV